MSENPYAKYVQGEDLLLTLERTPARIERTVRAWPSGAFERSHAPRKWSARQVLAHLAQAEMVFATRLRFGLAEDGYVVQPFDQDAWMSVESQADGLASLEAYLALRRMNLALCRGLTPAQRARTFRHPEKGEISVEWVMTFFAGHERNHVPQLEAIGASRRPTS
jgi:uncharacterized damage-inducible protein DinB